MSAFGAMSGNHLENNVAAVLGMREDAFQRQPNLFLVTHAYFKGDKPRMLSAAAASSGLVIVISLLVGLGSFSPFRAGPAGRISIDLAANPLAKPYEKAFAVVLKAGRTSPAYRSRLVTASPAEGRRKTDVVPVMPNSLAPTETPPIPDKSRSLAHISGSQSDRLPNKSVEPTGGDHSPDTAMEQQAPRGWSAPPQSPPESTSQTNAEKSETINRALFNRRTGIDALRALRRQ